MNKQQKFNKICKDIKSIKIQGATNLSLKAFFAYNLIPTPSSKKKLLSLRPTEPMLFNILKTLDRISYKELKERFENNQKIINKNVFKLIKNNSIIFTHCHSTSVVKALIYCKKKGKKFEVYNTETRPLYQGRKTSKELKKAGIRVTMFIDSAAQIALTKSQDKEQKTKPVSIIFFGADALLNRGIINKVGSGMFAQIAKLNNIPVYIVSDSLKYSKKNIKIEQRNKEEVWNNKNIEIKNPAFDLIDKKNISGIISELGLFSYDVFLRKMR